MYRNGGFNPTHITHPQRIIRATDWLLSALAACDGQGFSHSYTPLLGWRTAYPETTGYIIPTLLALHNEPDIRAHYHAQGIDLQRIAHIQGYWLLSLQLHDGAFPGLLVGHTEPSVFNTGMILFGLAALMEHTTDSRDRELFCHAAQRAAQFLYDNMDSEGRWRRYTYVEGYAPSYHAYAFYGLYKVTHAAKRVGFKGFPECDFQAVLRTYLAYQRPDGSWHHCGFWPEKPAFTHTLAYTLQGILGVGGAEATEAVIRTLDALMAAYNTHHKLAGSCGPNAWEADYSYICVTGHAQLACVCFEVADALNEPRYAAFGTQILGDTLPTQSLKTGALPGSVPFWGPYMRFRYPNWAAKYFIDALLLHGNAAYGEK